MKVPIARKSAALSTFSSTEELFFKKFISKLGKDTFTYLPAVIIPAALSLVSVMIFTRMFMPNAYGQYALVIATAGILTVLLSQWIQQSVLRYLPRFKEKQRLPEFIGNLVIILLIVTIPVILLFAFIYPLVKSPLGLYSRFYLYGVSLVIGGVLFGILNTVFQANLQSRKYTKYQVAHAAGRLALSLAFIFLIARDVVGLIIGATASYVILIGPMIKELGLLGHRKDLVKFFNPTLPKMLKKFAFYGFPMVGWFVGAQILGISDRFIIGAFKGSAQAGIYASNYDLVSTGIGLVASPILMAAHPLIMNVWESGYKDRVQETIAAFSRYFLLAAIPLMAYISVFSQETVAILLGKAYREGYVIIPIILVGFLAWYFAMYGHKGLEIMEKTRIMLLLVITCATTNVVLNLFFVPLYGYIGAAITTLVSYLLYPLLVYRATKPYVKWQIPWRSVGNIVISSLAMAGLLVALKFAIAGRLDNILALAISGGIAVPIYFGLLSVLGEIKAYEIRYLKGKVYRLGLMSRP